MNDTDLKTVYKQLGDAVPEIGDADVVVRRVRRRRVAARIGVPALVATVVAAALAVGQSWPQNGQDLDVASAPPPLSLDDWAEVASQTNGAAMPGTLIHTCGKDCFRLRRPDGREVDLAKERPDLVKLLRNHAFYSAGLSWDAQWLGLRVGREYQLHKLADRERSISVPAGPAGSQWEAVGWSPDSRYVALAAFRSKRVARYAWVSLGDGKITTYDPAAGARALPERPDAPDGVVIAVPLDTSRPVEKRTRVTKLAPDVLRLTGDEQGKIRQLYDPAPDLARYLRADETLAGPRGVAASTCAPPLDSASRPQCVTAVWAPHGETGNKYLRATGAVQTLAPEQPDKAIRWNVPRSYRWQYLGLLPTGELAASRLSEAVDNDESDDQEIVAIDSAGKQRVVGRVSFVSPILLPGMALSSCCRDW